MKPQTFAVVYKLRDDTFLTPEEERQVWGFLPSEVWIFGTPTQPHETRLSRAVAAACVHLGEDQVHRIAGMPIPAPIFHQEYGCFPTTEKPRK